MLGHLPGESLDLPEHLVGPVDRNLVAADRDIGFHAGREMGADDLDDTSDGLRAAAGLDHEFHDDDIAFLGTAEFAAGNNNLVRDATVVRLDEADLALDVQLADNALVCAFQHLDDGPLTTPLVIDAGNTHDHPVAMQHLAHLARQQEKILAAIVRDQESESVLVPLDATGDQLLAVDEAVTPAAVANQLAITDHRLEPELERFGLLSVQFEVGGDLRSAERAALALHRLHDEFPARDGIVVLPGLPLVVGITGSSRFSAFCHLSFIL